MLTQSVRLTYTSGIQTNSKGDPMRNVMSFPKTLAVFFSVLCLSSMSLSAADIPASAAAAGPLGGVGGKLRAEYWKRAPASILTDGATVPANRIDTQINGFGPANGTFVAKKFVYLGNDLTPV